ncbi:MAG: caspase family protein [Pseudomonadota bacterium]
MLFHGVRALRLILAIVVTLFAFAPFSLASERLALVIGNSAYEHVSSLRNPVNDANDISAALTLAGFEVETQLDLGHSELLRALQSFGKRSRGADMAIIYYAGHGIEVSRRNYLIPVNASLDTDMDVAFEAVPLDRALLAVEGAQKLRLVIVDACRDNPFASTIQQTSSSRSIGRGLALIEPAGATLVAYAAKEGTIANDGTGRNSPYAEALIKVIEEPGVEIGKMFRRVRDEVLRETGGTQEPFLYGSVPAEDLYLNPPIEVPEPEPEPKVVEEEIASLDPSPQDKTFELAFWNAIVNSNDARDFEDYLERFPNGVFAGLAARRIVALKPPETEPQGRNSAEGSLSMAPSEEKVLVGAEDAPTIAAALDAPASGRDDKIPSVETAMAAPQIDRTALLAPKADALEQAPLTDPRYVAFTSEVPDIEINRDRIRAVQMQLNALGFDTGLPDGIIGPKTRAGVSAFQVSMGTDRTGEVDAFLVANLGQAISVDRATVERDVIRRHGTSTTVGNLRGLYCLDNGDGTLADGLDGRAMICNFVRPRGQGVEMQTFYAHVRRSGDDPMTGLVSRFRAAGDGQFRTDAGTEISLTSEELNLGSNRFLRSTPPG